LHAGQHAHHLAQVDIADQPARQRAFDMQFLHGGLLHDGDAGLLGRDVDEDVFSHSG
jgi:hypothetical protein